jgi:hypothetical protein
VRQTLSGLTSRQAQEVVRWRRERLLESGYDAATASSLAKQMDIDLHLAVRLVYNGCPPATAFRILV